METEEHSGYEEMGLEQGSAEYFLQLQFRKLVAKARDISRGQAKLQKLLYEIKRDDRLIDRSFRRVLSAAKSECSRVYQPQLPSISNIDAFSEASGNLILIESETPFVSSSHDERVCIAKFMRSVKRQHEKMLFNVGNMQISKEEGRCF